VPVLPQGSLYAICSIELRFIGEDRVWRYLCVFSCVRLARGKAFNIDGLRDMYGGRWNEAGRVTFWHIDSGIVSVGQFIECRSGKGCQY